VQDCKKTLRVQMLEELSAQLHAEFLEANKGVREKVLFESTDRKGMMEGYTGNYIRISQPYAPELIGKIVDVTI
jgi:threonylcarbamoyladenosine tRNA methylthiotransferase MtaB